MGSRNATRRTTSADFRRRPSAAAALSNRYIPSRQLPDKAIDLVDEAASRLRMEIDSAPEEIDQLRRAVDRLTMEELALKNETDPASKERLAALAQRHG